MLPFMGNDLLQGEKVRLTRPAVEDADTIARWTGEMEGQRLLRRGMVYPSTADEVMKWFLNPDPEGHFLPFVIRTKSDDRLIGIVAFKDIQWQARNASFFISIGEPADRDKGCGTDAVRVLLKYAFQEMNLYRVGLEVMDYNIRAIRSYERAGFRPEGRMRACVYRDGLYYDILLMSILRPEWDDLYGVADVSG